MSAIHPVTALVIAMYLRQSKDAHDDHLAVDRQRDLCLAYAKRRWPGATIVEFCDNDKSASSGAPRPDYIRMCEWLGEGRLDGVVVYDLDRLHRLTQELEEFIKLVERMKISELGTVSGDIDLSTDMGRLHARIMGAVARHEMEKKARRQRDMHDQRAALGTPWCPRRPFGFVPIYDDATGKIKTLAHEEGEATLVRAAYAEVLSGVGTSTIVREWNAAEVPTTAGGKWSEPTLRRLLLNPRNAGHRIHDGVITKEDAWTPIVTAEIFDGVNAIITMKSRGKQRARRYLLSGIATCYLCGAGMESSVIKKNADATAVRTYKCSGCTRVSRKAQLLDDYVVEALLKRLARADAEALLIDAAKDANADKRAALKAVNAEMEELEQDRRDPDLQMTRAEYKTSRMALLARRDAIEVSIQEVTAAPLLLPLVRSANLKQDWDAYGIDRQRLVMKLLVTCVVKPVGRGVRWNSDAVEVAIR